eukprot:7385662-Prymnesium_polylepis.2
MQPIGGGDVSLAPPPANRLDLLRRRGKNVIIIFEALLFRARIYIESGRSGSTNMLVGNG